MPRPIIRHRPRCWSRRLRRVGAGLLGVLVCIVYARAGWLGLAALALGVVDGGVVWFLVRLEQAGSHQDLDRPVRPQVVVARRPVTPSWSVEKHAAFAGALVEVAERYRAECERQAEAEAAAATRGLTTGGVP